MLNEQKRREIDIKNIILSPIDLTRAKHTTSKTATSSRIRALRTLIYRDKTLIV